MSAEKSMAIVLRVVEFSETSVITTLFTREFGKIGALAKGARRPKSPFESALDLLAVCRVVFLRKSTDALDLLTEAKLERRFRAASRSLNRLYAGFYVAELLRELTDQGDPDPSLFDLANQTLQAIDGAEELFPTVLRFELGLLRLLGHMPTLFECAGCGLELPTTTRVAFGHLAGGVLCPNCRSGQRQVVSLTTPSLDVLRQLADDDQCQSAIVIERRLRGELRGVLNQYVTHLLGYRPRLTPYLQALASDTS
ncbi:MAG: DNA repair protein RecO [Planctomycetota bacterium]